MTKKVLDPVEGLVDYVLDVKPYHTKIAEVLVEYIYGEQVNVTITERLEWLIEMRNPDHLPVSYDCGYDTGGWGGEGVNPNLYSVVLTDDTTNQFTVTGDQTANLQPGTPIVALGPTSFFYGNFTVYSSWLSGANTIVQVMQMIPSFLVGSVAWLGHRRLGYDEPTYCDLASAPDLFVGVHIHEYLEFVGENGEPGIQIALEDRVRVYNLENTDSTGYNGEHEFGSSPWDLVPNIVTHGIDSVNYLGSYYTGLEYYGLFQLIGGNWTYRFNQALHFTTRSLPPSPPQLLEWQATTLPIVGINNSGVVGTHYFEVEGDWTDLFNVANGRIMIKREAIDPSTVPDQVFYTVISAVCSDFVCTRTQIIVGEQIDTTQYYNPDFTPIVQQVWRDYGVIHGAVFNPVTFATHVAARLCNNIDNPTECPYVNPLPITIPVVNYMQYEWRGPVRMDIDAAPLDVLDVDSLADDLQFDDSFIIVPLFFEIIDVDLLNNTFTIIGNHVSYFYATAQFNVVGSFSGLNDLRWAVDAAGATYNPILDVTVIPVYGTIFSDSTPYGLIQVTPPANTGTRASASITETIDFAWITDEWWQYMIVGIDPIDMVITVAGNATQDIQLGEELDILNPSSVGTWRVVPFNNGSTIIYGPEYLIGPDQTRFKVIGDPLLLSYVGGFVDSGADEAGVYFYDTVGISVAEEASAVVIESGGTIGSWDYPYWDVYSYDETLGTVVRLYSGSF